MVLESILSRGELFMFVVVVVHNLEWHIKDEHHIKSGPYEDLHWPSKPCKSRSTNRKSTQCAIGPKCPNLLRYYFKALFYEMA